MKTRWFGEPWPAPDDRGPICEDDSLRVEVPVGYRCIRCEHYFKEADQGIVMPVMGGKWRDDFTFGLIADDTNGKDALVAGEHLDCFLHDVLGDVAPR